MELYHITGFCAIFLILLGCAAEVPQFILINESASQPAAKKPALAATLQNITPETAENDPLLQMIQIKYLFFFPNETTVKKGTRVIWINKDDVKTARMVRSLNIVSTPTEKKYLFGSERLTLGETFSYLFNETGLFRYYDPLFSKKDTFIGGYVKVE